MHLGQGQYHCVLMECRAAENGVYDVAQIHPCTLNQYQRNFINLTVTVPLRNQRNLT